jgi:hypothetical protein
MMFRMGRRRLAICLLLASLAIPATVVRADDSDLPDYDARTQGYAAGVPTHMEDSGTIGAWFIFVPLAAVALGVLFKNAKRSYLD